MNFMGKLKDLHYRINSRTFNSFTAFKFMKEHDCREH